MKKAIVLEEPIAEHFKYQGYRVEKRGDDFAGYYYEVYLPNEKPRKITNVRSK